MIYNNISNPDFASDIHCHMIVFKFETASIMGRETVSVGADSETMFMLAISIPLHSTG